MYGTPKIELAEKEFLQKVKISVGDLCSGFLVFLSLVTIAGVLFSYFYKISSEFSELLVNPTSRSPFTGTHE